MEADVALEYGSVMPKHTDDDLKKLSKDFDAVLGAHVGESIVESEKATKMTLREAFDAACEIATTMRLNVTQHDEAVKAIAELRAKVGGS